MVVLTAAVCAVVAYVSALVTSVLAFLAVFDRAGRSVWRLPLWMVGTLLVAWAGSWMCHVFVYGPLGSPHPAVVVTVLVAGLTATAVILVVAVILAPASRAALRVGVFTAVVVLAGVPVATSVVMGVSALDAAWETSVSRAAGAPAVPYW